MPCRHALVAGLALVALGPAAPAGAPQRPPVIGRSAGVSTGHPLTTAAAVEILLQGGNAFDAGVAALLVGGVVEQDLYGFGGESLVLVYPRADRRVTSVVGQGWAPRAATIDWYRSRGKTLAGEGLDPAVVPGAPHAALTVLERWGTMTLAQVARAAIAHARDGFALRPRTAQTIERQRAFIARWPTNQRTWLKADGSFYEAGDTLALPELAATLQKMVDAESGAASRGRVAGIQAARDRFYKGDIAQEMVRFLREHGAPFDAGDFADFYARVEPPASVSYRGLTVYKHGFNSQGPVLLQALNILETFDLKALGHNSADYLHVLTEALKLAYADRDSYYADPAFVRVPEAGLLSKAYARARAGQIDRMRAQPSQIAGDPLPFDPDVKSWPYWVAGRQGSGLPPEPADADPSLKDTTHVAIIDKDGNVFDATPSGGWIPGGVVAGSTGVALSTRGEQFWLDPTRAAQLRPRSRPRYTLTPTLVLRNGEPYLALGTPGGDNQEQTILQAFLNIVEFPEKWYPNLHTAFELPRLQTFHFLGSFWPHRIDANRLDVEAGIGESIVASLKARGHDVRLVPAVSISGCATAVLIDPRTGSRIAGADPRRDCYAFAY
jgi:gamma-glutamyltranspeptidase/glutathione hydrolase